LGTVTNNHYAKSMRANFGRAMIDGVKIVAEYIVSHVSATQFDSLHRELLQRRLVISSLGFLSCLLGSERRTDPPTRTHQFLSCLLGSELVLLA
tara:strand:- start:18486 stop:18767 length:282 start_codon:yes stop_codon:yes gene_type:complete